MTEQPRGIDRRDLDPSFEADEVLKSNLILEAQVLVAQQQADAAADRFAKAAEIEERLGSRCAELSLLQKSWVHLFSAASCWARAGDFHTALGVADELLAEPDLPSLLRQRVLGFADTIRQRRSEWSVGLALLASAD